VNSSRTSYLLLTVGYFRFSFLPTFLFYPIRQTPRCATRRCYDRLLITVACVFTQLEGFILHPYALRLPRRRLLARLVGRKVVTDLMR